VIAPTRRLPVAATAALLALLGAAAVPAGPTTAPAPSVTAVVSLVADAGRAVLAGVRVVSEFPALSAAVVSGTPAQLAVLRGRPGVRSVVADYSLRPTGHEDEAGGSVYATEGLGGSPAATTRVAASPSPSWTPVSPTPLR
jgi:hypothetical protein